MLQSLHRVWAGSQSSMAVKDVIWPGIRLLPILVHTVCVLYFALVIVLSYMCFFLCILYGSYITILPFSHLYLILFSVQFLSLLCFTLPLCICHPPPPFILGAVKEKHYLFLLADSSGALPTVKQYLLYLFKTYLHMAQHQSQVINQFLLLCISLHSASTFLMFAVNL